MKPTITLCALVKDITESAFTIRDRDGERRLSFAETLQPYQFFINEALFAVSDQTTDNTLEILKNATREWNIPVTIYSYEWIDDFSAALNNLFERSKGDWNLRLHGDRYIPKASLPFLQESITKEGVVVVRAEERDMNRNVRSYFPVLTRKEVRYSGLIWEHPVKRPEKPTGRIADHCVLPHEELFEKNIRCYHDDAGDDKRKPIWRRITNKEILRIKNQISKAESAADYLTLGNRIKTMATIKFLNWNLAIIFYTKASELEPNSYAPQELIGDCYRIMGKPQKAEDFYKEAIRLGSGTAKEKLDGLTFGSRQNIIF